MCDNILEKVAEAHKPKQCARGSLLGRERRHGFAVMAPLAIARGEELARAAICQASGKLGRKSPRPQWSESRTE